MFRWLSFNFQLKLVISPRVDSLVCSYQTKKMVACSFAKQVLDSNPLAVSEILDIAPVLNKNFFEIQAIAEYRLTLSTYVT